MTKTQKQNQQRSWLIFRLRGAHSLARNGHLSAQKVRAFEDAVDNCLLELGAETESFRIQQRRKAIAERKF